MTEEVKILQDKVAKLEQIINLLVRPDRYVFERPIAPGAKGLKLGTATTQKISLYGVTPIVQASAISAPNAPAGTYIQNDAISTVNAVNSILSALHNIGIIG